MTTKDITEFRSRVEDMIAKRRLREAFATMADMCHRRMAWEVGDRLAKTEKAYAYMLSYVAKGVDDPDRAKVYDQIVSDLYGHLDALVRVMERVDSPTLYYNTVRTSALPGRQADISALLRSEKVDDRLRRDLFSAVWTAYPLGKADSEAISAALGSKEAPLDVQTLVVSALTMGALQVYDHRRLGLLLRGYMTAVEPSVRAAALVGALLILAKYKDRPIAKETQDILAAASDSPHWAADLRIAFLELIRARYTETINRKMMDEVIPRMMDLRPDIMSKIRDGKINPDDPMSIQENPEWQQMLESSGIADRLKELTELQLEGADVFMSTFANLKSFPFFSEISHWFLPYTPALAAECCPNAEEAMAAAIAEAPVLCDSDKYSFILALGTMPQQQRAAVSSQMQAQADALRDAAHDAYETDDDARRRHVNAYVQDIYRFFKLYGRKDEFADPFASPINLIAVPALEGDFTDADLLRVVAEFYFKLGYYAEAEDVFSRLDSMLPPDAQRYQKLGYCAEKSGHTSRAIDHYRRAELLDGTSLWTLKRLASCLRSEGRYDEALTLYRRLSELDPDNLNTALQYGYILLEKGDYAGAVKQFYKVEFLDEKSSRAWRPLAWTLFLTGDFEAAQRYYDKVLDDRPTATDYLNMGHTAAALGRMRDAINNYTLSLQLSGGDREKFLSSLMADAAVLSAAGVQRETVALLADTVFYSLDK